MNAERFAAIVDTYGAEPRRWPSAERREAEAFAASADGRRLMRSAVVLDDALLAHEAPAPSPGLRARVLEARPQPRRGLLSVFRWRPDWAPAGLAAAGLAGVLFGAALSQGWTDPRTEALLLETETFDLAALTGGDPL